MLESEAAAIRMDPKAVFGWSAYSRSSSVLAEHFDWLRGKPAVRDGMPGCPAALTDIIRGCFMYLLGKAELAVKAGIRQARPDTA